jgi:hypothetical protein
LLGDVPSYYLAGVRLRPPTSLALILAPALLGVGARSASAGPDDIVTSAADLGEPMGINVELEYDYAIDTAKISREQAGPGADPLGAAPRHTELVSHSRSHTITPRMELSLFHDTWLTVALPITVGQTHELELAPGVTRAGATTISDGLLTAAGFDANDPMTGLPTDGALLFRGVNRSGLSEVRLGMGIAPMNQRRQDTEPTWRLGAEALLSVGKVARFDRMNPSGENGVATGVHELRLWTSVAKTLGWAAPWWEAHWQVPLGTTSEALFDNPGYGATNTAKGQQAGTSFGVETYAVDRPDDHVRVAFDLAAHLTSHFEGRGYSELWELLAYAGDSRVATNPLILDADPTMAGTQAKSHPGITNIENYLDTGIHAAVRGELGPHVRFSAFGDITWQTSHVITFADAGVDLPTCSATVTKNCEMDNNDLVNPGTAEVNPLAVPKIDLVGHRYRSEHGVGLIFGVSAQILF